mgnify:FL=1
MDRQLKIGERIAQKSILQGGMGVGVSLGNLAGAVSKCGGVGMISAAQIGFREPDFDENTEEANVRAMHQEYEKARQIAPEGVIGFNIMVAMRHYERYVREAVQAGADLIVSGAGLPMDLPALTGKAKTALAPIVSSERSARLILKYWDRKYHRLPDLLVIEGPLAGGHLGFSTEQLIEYMQEKKKNFDEEVKRILDAVKEFAEKAQKYIPVALAGGISSREQAEHAFRLGVDAIQVATRFVTTEECDADIRYKRTYLQAQEEDIVITKSPVGMPGRAILNPFLKKIQNGEQIRPEKCHGCLKHCKPAEIPYCITDALIHAAKGEVDEALLFCGAEAWKAQKIQTVEEVIRELLGEE